MRNLFLAAGLCLAIPSTPLAAEPGPSLEQDYAALCANKPEPASETCVLLKKALIAKLSGNASSPATAELPFTARSPAAPSIEQAKREEIRRRWGLYADMVGKTYVEVDTKGSPLAIATYSWEVPGAAMVVTRYATTETGEITTGDCPPSKTYRRVEPATGRLTRTILRPCWPAVPAADVSIQPDGAAVEKQVDGKYTDRISRNSDGTVTWIRYVPQKNGLWRRLGYGTSISHERTSQYLASLRADYEARLAQKAQSGDGFGSILAGAAMGAMLGGGGQSSVDLAIAGAQSAAQGGNTLDVLNSMGGVAAANAAESKRELDETIARAEGRSSTGSSGSGGSYVASASTASAGAAGSAGASAGTRTRYTFCIDDRTTRDAKGMIKEVIFYSRIGPITRRTDEYFRDTSVEGFAAAVDRISDLQRQSTPNCPQFDTRAQAENDFSLKRQIERPDVRPFVYVQGYIPE